jgi:hypothetical protein
MLLALRKALIAEQDKRMQQRGLDPGKDMRTIFHERHETMRERRWGRHGIEPPVLTALQKADLPPGLDQNHQSCCEG